MLQRLGGLAVFVFWCAATGWLVWHDVWPAWTAQSPPAPGADWVATHPTRLQTGVFDRFDQRRGTIWTVYEIGARLLSRDEVVYLDHCAPLPPLRIDIETRYDQDGSLDELRLRVYGAELPIELKGERFGSQVAFKLDAGPIHQSFKLSSTDAAMVRGSVNPFPILPDLHVGQTWRMQVFDPLAALSGQSGRFSSVVAKVTGLAPLDTGSEPVECFVVQAAQARAWVRRDGRVVQQEVELPMLGKIVLRDEPFDEAAYRAAGRSLPRR